MTGVLVGLSATRTMSSKRLQFYKESSNGYDVNSYFWSVNVMSVLEHGVQMLLAGAVSFWIRHPISAWYTYLLNFFLLSWAMVSWGHTFSLLISPENLTLATGLFMLFFNLLWSGVTPPVTVRNFVSSARFASDPPEPRLTSLHHFVSQYRAF